MELFFRKLGIGPPLIILHGLYGSSDNWITIGKALAEQFTVYIPDQRNHGSSPHSGDHDYYALRDDLLEFMDKNKIQKSTFIGHSMGGKTTMFFAVAYPERVKNFIIVDISPRSYISVEQNEQQSIDHMNIINALINVDLNLIQSRTELDKMLANDIKNSSIRQFLLKNLVREGNQKFRWKINIQAIRNHLPDIMAGLKENDKNENTKNIPCLFIKGELSDYLLERDHELVKSFFPKA